MNDHIKWKDYVKKIDGINYECIFNDDEVICSEYEDNPHGINNEVPCSLKEFLDKFGDNAIRCHSFIKKYFGNNKYENLICIVQANCQKTKNPIANI